MNEDINLDALTTNHSHGGKCKDAVKDCKDGKDCKDDIQATPPFNWDSTGV